MIITRQKYLDMLVAGQGNGLVKIVTGGRRCGKSFLLFQIFHQYLLQHGVDEGHLIEVSLDDRRNRKLCDPDALLDYLDSRIKSDGKTNFIFLDEIQLVDDFIGVLLSLMHTPNTEVYVSGSNSKFLSKDVVTEFRGRGQEIRIWPLSFSEYYGAVGGERSQAWKDYYTFGGLPQILSLGTERAKRSYLRDIYEVTYIKDIVERNKIKVPEGLRELVRILASGIGSSTNPTRICNTFQSVSQLQITDKTINEYISDIQDAFLIEEALRYDVKGRKYIGTETKYYFCDLGLRNIVLNLRQQEETHIMENVIYNELRMRGYLVDVGLVECWTTNENGKRKRSKLEVDFVVNNGPERVYIQSAFNMPTKDKEKQERRSLINIADNFRKVIVVKDDIKRKIDDDGVVTIGLFDFLLDEQSIERY
ncbi:ATP-binding protein [Prevotella copri]|jgi:predicted AAA+ superfamily ATPase|uniref:ATP-binding protein n=3 Tax=Pseudomonadati TaxID=3379134 RepID=A0AAW5IUG9_9BACT|nr:ATP-binding protein [Segatella copri]MCP9552878.1 ATP-binding protein [Segatella copri]MCP9573598.1 ATP-binding protein [Segatella copri]MCP9576725.1 ATP-binding protein [Segatella copri]MCP9579560.1 ATP-binding protein [Segatella copri]MCP9582493.1 ATP-binding protein [Segatella copri]